MHRPLHPARRNLAGQARESPGEDSSGKDPARFLRRAGTWGTTPTPTGALRAARRRFSRQQRKTLEPEGKRERGRKKNCLPGPGPASQPPSPPARSSQGKQLLTSPCVLPARSLLPGGRGRGARPGGGAERAGRPAFLSPRSSSPPPLAPASSFRPQFGAWLGFSRPGKFLLSTPVQLPSLSLATGIPAAPAVPSLPLASHPALPSAALSLTPNTRSSARTQPPISEGRAAPDARAPRGCPRPGP